MFPAGTRLKVATTLERTLPPLPPLPPPTHPPPIPEIQQFQNLTLKIQDQGHGWGHGWGQSLKSNVSLTSHRHTSLSFSVNEPSHSWDTVKNWPWKSKLKVISEGHIVGITPYRLISLLFNLDKPSHSYIQLFKNLTLKIQTQGHGRGARWKSQHRSNMLSTHIPFVSCQSAIPFLWYDFFKIWPLKPKVKVMVEVKVESHKVSVTSYQLTSLSFHVNRPFHSWDTKFSNLTLKIQVEAQMTMMTHNYRSRQFHITLSGINASSGFRDMASTKSSPSAASFEKFWTMGKPMWGNWANYYDSTQLQVYTSP